MRLTLTHKEVMFHEFRCSLNMLDFMFFEILSKYYSRIDLIHEFLVIFNYLNLKCDSMSRPRFSYNKNE